MNDFRFFAYPSTVLPRAMDRHVFWVGGAIGRASTKSGRTDVKQKCLSSYGKNPIY